MPPPQPRVSRVKEELLHVPERSVAEPYLEEDSTANKQRESRHRSRSRYSSRGRNERREYRRSQSSPSRERRSDRSSMGLDSEGKNRNDRTKEKETDSKRREISEPRRRFQSKSQEKHSSHEAQRQSRSKTPAYSSKQDSEKRRRSQSAEGLLREGGRDSAPPFKSQKLKVDLRRVEESSLLLVLSGDTVTGPPLLHHVLHIPIWMSPQLARCCQGPPLRRYTTTE